METFEIRDLTFTYPEQQKAALSHITLRIPEGSFAVLCGPSGCGKSTLLRQCKTVLTPHGTRSGEILFEGQALGTLGQEQESRKIGFVQQSPDHQIVTDKVWHELAFGLESLGLETPVIRRRTAEMAAFFGIESWFYKNVTELSGGQKQLLNLASVMAMQPSVLILDEPTSQLDPIAASDFLSALGKINRELGTTILLTEHRLEEVFPFASMAAVMEEGRILCTGTPEEVGAFLKKEAHPMFLAMPGAMRIWAAVENDARCPVTVRDGRQWLRDFAETHPLAELRPEPVRTYPETPVISAEDIWFRYEKDAPDVVRGLSVSLRRGECLALLGGNGTGKTTTLKLLAGILHPVRGTLQTHGTIGVLPQNPQALFVRKTVREDLFEIFRGTAVPKAEQEQRTARLVQLCRLGDLLDRHPYDLSGGEQQRAALAKVLLLQPEILLMDEPTKGLDAEFKQVFAEILAVLLHRGVSVLMVSHDIEFCAEYAHRCALFFDGSIVTDGTPRQFFADSSFYTTAANRIAREVLPEAVTVRDVIEACGGKSPAGSALPEETASLPPPAEEQSGCTPAKLPGWRKVLAAVSGGTAAAILLYFLRVTDLHTWISADGITAFSAQQLWLYGVFLVSAVVFACSITKRSTGPVQPRPAASGKLAKRTIAASVLILLLIPLTLFAGEALFAGRKYYFISLLILLEMMLPFFLVFEGRKPQARELVIIAVLCAVGVAGRAAFFMLPEFKPVLALTILAGVAFGGETGFLVGAVTMLASNALFSQGPYAPWQMFSMGIIGFLAGVLFRKGMLRRSRISLCVFGFLSAILIYGGLMNFSSALLAVGELHRGTLLAYYISGFPMDCIHAEATWFFLWIGAEPILEKLDRIKVKYGLIES